MLLGAYSGCLTKVVAFARNIFIVKKEEHNRLNNNYFLFIFIFIYFILSILTFDGIVSLFPFIAAIIYKIVVWNGDEKTLNLLLFYVIVFG